MYRAHIVALLCTTLGLAPVLSGQSGPQQVRLIAAGDTGTRTWQGYLQRLTIDSIELRVLGADTTASFARSAIRSFERPRHVRAGHAAGVGCLSGGAALGTLGYLGSHDPDSPGRQPLGAVLGLVAGCGVGAVGGLLVAVVRGPSWELWNPPDSLPTSSPPNELRN